MGLTTSFLTASSSASFFDQISIPRTLADDSSLSPPTLSGGRRVAAAPIARDQGGAAARGAISLAIGLQLALEIAISLLRRSGDDAPGAPRQICMISCDEHISAKPRATGFECVLGFVIPPVPLNCVLLAVVAMSSRPARCSIQVTDGCDLSQNYFEIHSCAYLVTCSLARQLCTASAQIARGRTAAARSPSDGGAWPTCNKLQEALCALRGSMLCMSGAQWRHNIYWHVIRLGGGSAGGERHCWSDYSWVTALLARQRAQSSRRRQHCAVGVRGGLGDVDGPYGAWRVWLASALLCKSSGCAARGNAGCAAL
eukprot:3338705-Pleurochrysis_carterae.AAC.1